MSEARSQEPAEIAAPLVSAMSDVDRYDGEVKKAMGARDEADRRVKDYTTKLLDKVDSHDTIRTFVVGLMAVVIHDGVVLLSRAEKAK